VKPGKLNPGGLSSRIPHWIYPLGFLMSQKTFARTVGESLPASAHGKPLEIWFQML
jgi:hypothetical protein